MTDFSQFDPDPPVVPGTDPLPGGADDALQPASADSAGEGIYDYLRAGDAPLQECLDDFWTFGLSEEALPDIDAPSAGAYDIIKRLGPSPFESGSFPLIGFLASAYDRVSRFVDERREE